MTAQQRFASDYIDVAARIVTFREQHPDGSLQPADPAAPYRVEVIGGDTFIVVVAAAYRSPTDERPGIGMAYEVYPGRTSFTRGSELQNAETSAWGRAIVAALAADTKKGIASSEEVRNRQAEREDPLAIARLAVQEQGKRLSLDFPALRARYAEENNGAGLDEAGPGELRTFAALLSREGTNGLPLNKDGSVSKRQSTDEARTAAGMMSDEEAEAHKALVAEVTDSSPAERHAGGIPPEQDPWTETVAQPGAKAGAA